MLQGGHKGRPYAESLWFARTSLSCDRCERRYDFLMRVDGKPFRSIWVEAVAEPLGRRITELVAVPTIGIGASPACDGQILVLEDMLGLSPRVPKFVKRYGDLGPGIEAAIAAYAKDVRSRAFPGPEQVYAMRAPAKGAKDPA